MPRPPKYIIPGVQVKEVTLIFPDQLFRNHPAVKEGTTVVLAEEFLYFRVQEFHFQRLVLLSAAMRAYADRLKNRGIKVIYIETAELKSRGVLFCKLAEMGVKSICYAEFADEWLRQDLQQATQKYQWQLKSYPTPGFICLEGELRNFFQGKKTFSMAQFYAYQRKKLNLLMAEGKPLGGKFSFDTENRKKIPKEIKIPEVQFSQPKAYVDDAVIYVRKHFPKAIGDSGEFLYPLTHEDADKALASFINQRLTLFGDYEDAIRKEESFLYHSVLSPLLNIGLLTPIDVVKQVQKAYEQKNAPLNSVEGFVRQVIGWREYVRASYLLLGNQQRVGNFFKHKRPLPKGFWDGTTGIEPIDTTIKKVLKTGYCHHIERLMVLGNFLLLMETDRKEVYRWFMAYFVDAYDWVMVPNVYGMSQYADGGMVTTKPYISGSNYLLKMSDYRKGEWSEIWDGLFWRFLSKHRKLFGNNPRTNMLLEMYEKNRDQILPKIACAEKRLRLECN